MAKNTRPGQTPPVSLPRPPANPPPAPDPHAEVVTAISPHLEALEAAIGAKVITLYLEDSAQLGDEQCLHLYEHLRRLGRQSELGLFVSSRGGATEVPWKIVSLLREFTDVWWALVPYRAHSAATVLCLGADSIVMTEMSELGPIDPTRRHPLLPAIDTSPGNKQPLAISVQDLRHVLKFLEREIGRETLTAEAAATVYTALFDKVHPLAVGALEQSWALAGQIARQVLGTHMDSEKEADQINAIVDQLSDGYSSHLYQISRVEAETLGLKVRRSSAAETDAMWALYVAYSQVTIEGDGQINGQPAIVRRRGHMDSSVGNSLGFDVVGKSDPSISQAQWKSIWR